MFIFEIWPAILSTNYCPDGNRIAKNKILTNFLCLLLLFLHGAKELFWQKKGFEHFLPSSRFDPGSDKQVLVPCGQVTLFMRLS